jgi:hypothetical protein
LLARDHTPNPLSLRGALLKAALTGKPAKGRDNRFTLHEEGPPQLIAAKSGEDANRLAPLDMEQLLDRKAVNKRNVARLQAAQNFSNSLKPLRMIRHGRLVGLIKNIVLLYGTYVSYSKSSSKDKICYLQ